MPFDVRLQPACVINVPVNPTLDEFYQNYDQLGRLAAEHAALGWALGMPLDPKQSAQRHAEQLSALLESRSKFREYPDFPDTQLRLIPPDIPLNVWHDVRVHLVAVKARWAVDQSGNKIIVKGNAAARVPPAWQAVMDGLSSDTALWGDIRRVARERNPKKPEEFHDAIAANVGCKLLFSVFCTAHARYLTWRANPAKYKNWRGALYATLQIKKKLTNHRQGGSIFLRAEREEMGLCGQVGKQELPRQLGDVTEALPANRERSNNDSMDPADLAEAREELERAEALLKAVPETCLQIRIIQMRFRDGLSTESIASQLKITAKNAGSHLVDAIKYMRDRYFHD